MTGKLFLAAFFALAVTLASLAAAIVPHVQFDRQCAGHLNRAAAANTVALARTEMATAMDYATSRGLTHGYTSIFYQTPDEDVGFWYENLKGAMAELAQAEKAKTQLERTNVLLKLHETIHSHAPPSSIEYYPNNLLYGALQVGVVIFALFTLFLIMMAFADLE